ncbi:MAG: alginate lyase family protein [Planctomycetales bacterium]|nr:alginate lyase family protein [Planctomycetales bacterium]
MSFSRSKINRVISVVRYHRPAQLIYRLAARLERIRLVKTKGGRYARPFCGPVSFRPLDGETSQFAVDAYCVKNGLEPSDSSKIRNAVAAGNFTLLNETKSLGNPIDWRCASVGATHLWQFNLHYNEFLYGCVADSTNEEASEVCLSVLRDWIESNPVSNNRVHRDAWHPFCVSRRLKAWFVLLSRFDRCADVGDILASAVRQADFLSNHLEEDLGGNHLIENLRTLALASWCLDCSETKQWLEILNRRIPIEIEKQILGSGEHFELSPFYHCEMLDAFLDIASACRETCPTLAQQCSSVAQRMATFANAMRHPNGELPLFSDGTTLASEQLDRLISRAQTSGAKSSTEPSIGGALVGDYWIYRNGGDFLIWDAGQFGPDHLPAHGHSDLLGFEASIGGSKFIVDTGTFEYNEGPIRDVVRATASHNCLEIDSLNQCDVYSRFRLGHRGRVDKTETGSNDNLWWATARHNAYRDIGVPFVHRLIACGSSFWLIVDWFSCNKPHSVVSHLHFAPDVSLSLCNGHVQANIRSRDVFIYPLGKLKSVDIEHSKYFPKMGEEVASSKLVQRCDATPPHFAVGWLFQLSSDPEPEIEFDGQFDSDGKIAFSLSGFDTTFRWQQT